MLLLLCCMSKKSFSKSYNVCDEFSDIESLSFFYIMPQENNTCTKYDYILLTIKCTRYTYKLRFKNLFYFIM